MNNYSKLGAMFLSGLILSVPLKTNAQSLNNLPLKSLEEDYADFLSLTGELTPEYLNFRTLSDSTWTFSLNGDSSVPMESNSQQINHLWGQNNLGTMGTLFTPSVPKNNWFVNGINQRINYRIYGPENYSVYNVNLPYGYNDMGMWQGKGFNSALTAGFRFEGYGLELTFRPQISFSQNLPFDYMTPESYTKDTTGKYKDKADTYGYIYKLTMDKPQRFGDSAFFNFDFGDSEIRYSWNNLTLGFGTEPIWLGPAKFNPQLHSNNAQTYPKIDAGLRKQKIILPFTDINLGFIEGRIWTGYLTESDYYDNDPENDHNLLHGLSMSYAPSFIPGLTLGANRICLVHAQWSNMIYIIPMNKNTIDNSNKQGEDQKISFTLDWKFAKYGFECYSEWAFDDFTSNKWANPFHTMTVTAGVKQALSIPRFPDFKILLFAEFTSLEMSQDFQLQWTYGGLYQHHQITQGHTNRGQQIGGGNTTGGNCQEVGFELYHPKFKLQCYYNRTTPDNNYIYNKAVDNKASDINEQWYASYETHSGFQGTIDYFLLPQLTLKFGFYAEWVCNYKYILNNETTNYSISCGAKYNF